MNANGSNIAKDVYIGRWSIDVYPGLDLSSLQSMSLSSISMLLIRMVTLH